MINGFGPSCRGRFQWLSTGPCLLISIAEDTEPSFSLLVTHGAETMLDNTVKIKKYLDKLRQNKIKNRYKSSNKCISHEQDEGELASQLLI